MLRKFFYPPQCAFVLLVIDDVAEGGVYVDSACADRIPAPSVARKIHVVCLPKVFCCTTSAETIGFEITCELQLVHQCCEQLSKLRREALQEKVAWQRLAEKVKQLCQRAVFHCEALWRSFSCLSFGVGQSDKGAIAVRGEADLTSPE